VFTPADQLVIDVYRASVDFPASERYGLQGQLRKAAVSSAANIVEGPARRTQREYLNFLNIAAGSAAEARYLADVSGRLPSSCLRTVADWRPDTKNSAPV
jgi:four helix bundle protein